MPRTQNSIKLVKLNVIFETTPCTCDENPIDSEKRENENNITQITRPHKFDANVRNLEGRCLIAPHLNAASM